MSVNFKPLIDSNILIYAVDKESLYHEESVSVFRGYLQKGCYLADLSLVEFFQVITDGKKTPKPCSQEEASQYIKHYIGTPEIEVLKVNILDVLKNPKLTDNLKSYNVTRYGIYDYLIASCMRINGISHIITFNDKDFQKYEWLEPVNPKKHLTNQTNTTNQTNKPD